MSENSPSGILIENAALSLEGVLSASYEADCQTGIFTFCLEKCSARKIVDAMEGLGYSVEPILRAAKQIYCQQLVRLSKRSTSGSMDSSNKLISGDQKMEKYILHLLYIRRSHHGYHDVLYVVHGT
jgi:hypothetical protein